MVLCKRPLEVLAGEGLRLIEEKHQHHHIGKYVAEIFTSVTKVMLKLISLIF